MSISSESEMHGAPREKPEVPGGSDADSVTFRSGGGNIVLWSMFAVIATIGIGTYAFTLATKDIQLGFKKHEPLPVIKEAPAFSLMTAHGREVTLEDLKGRIWIADFIFTRCAGTCPEMSESMGNLQRSLDNIPELWPPALLVSFTVDPEWDTPEVLQDYGERHEAEPDKWVFLHGQYDEIQQLATKGFLLGVQKDGGSEIEPIIHSQSFVLVDPDGRIRGYYDGTDPEKVRQLIADVLRLLREYRN